MSEGVPVPPSIEEFVAARGDALLRFALMLSGDAHRAEDLVQSALARAYLRWNRIADLDAPEAYLKRMVVNEHLRWRARRSSREVPVQSTGSDVAAGDTANAHAERDAAWELLRTLPRRQRAVLVLRYYEDLPDADIASLLGCRESTVRSQAARGLAALRAVLPTMQREWTSS